MEKNGDWKPEFKKHGHATETLRGKKGSADGLLINRENVSKEVVRDKSANIFNRKPQGGKIVTSVQNYYQDASS